MESSSRTKSNSLQRSISPSGRFYSSFSSAFASSMSSFSTRSSGFLTRSASPTRVNLCRSVSPSPSVRFSTPPSRSISVSPRHQKQNTKALSGQKKTCMCSPTTHPGSFRCSLHKNGNRHQNHAGSYHSSHRLNARRSAMTNSLVRIGTVEGDLVKRALAALIRPSSHHQRRRADFQPRPSRLCNMSKAEDL
ncbi:unnamed protein product [Ilex paraguariensis]|uniref:Serine-rich protein-like protein n=1 Tax=Ilex paraguariensis TaxID=185542 RepID=A0ABC8RMT5_9AQUA